MPELDELREGLAANLAAIKGLQVNAYRLTRPTLPSAHIFPGPVEYDTAGSRGEDKWEFIVQVFVAKTLDKASQIRIDRFLNPSGAESVKAALEADRQLGGAAYDLRVVEATGYQEYVIDGIGVRYGTDFVVEVRASGE